MFNPSHWITNKKSWNQTQVNHRNNLIFLSLYFMCPGGDWEKCCQTTAQWCDAGRREWTFASRYWGSIRLRKPHILLIWQTHKSGQISMADLGWISSFCWFANLFNCNLWFWCMPNPDFCVVQPILTCLLEKQHFELHPNRHIGIAHELCVFVDFMLK